MDAKLKVVSFNDKECPNVFTGSLAELEFVVDSLQQTRKSFKADLYINERLTFKYSCVFGINMAVFVPHDQENIGNG